MGSKQHARLVSSTAKKDHLTLPGFDKVSIKPENTDVDKNRNLALNKAEEFLKEDDRCYRKLIEKKRGKGPGIEVDGIQAFVQRDRYAKGGEFVSVFADLKLS